MTQKITKCRICSNERLECVLNLGEQYLTGVFPKSKMQKVTRGPLELVKCIGENTCGLVQLAHSYDLSELYGENYGYRSGLNKSMVSHLRTKVEKIMSIIPLYEGDLVIDIGSNDGTTLGFYPTKLHLVGIDPSAEKFRSYYGENIDLIVDFFDAKLITQKYNKKAKVITSFSMFYDLEEPMKFMQQIYEVLEEEGIWVFEQSYLQHMIEQNSYDTVCQEHLEYYAIEQIKWMCDNIGFKIIDIEFNSVNGGSFSVVVTKQTSKNLETKINIDDLLMSEKIRGLSGLDIWSDFSKKIEKTRNDLLIFLNEAKNSGKKVFGLGASTKGNVLLQYCHITEDLLAAIGEVNDDKYGSFTPGTLIPIISETEILAANPDYILVLPWHFREFFISNPKFKGMKLVFPLPNFEIVEC